MSNTNWENKTRDFRTAKDADQTEFAAIIYGSAPIESGIVDERTADALDDFDVSDPLGVERWAESDIQFDTGTSEVANEIRRRKSVMGAMYPFEIDGNRIKHLRSTTLVYELCLAISRSPSLTRDEYVKLPRAFERLSCDIVKVYLGSGADGYRTGWPRDTFEDRPTRFKELVDILNEKTGEWNWSPIPGRPVDPSPQKAKDCGLDFVVWKPMPDGRKGQIFILGQCACGEDWVGKHVDLDLDELKDWIRPMTAVNPVRSFLIPHHISNEEALRETNQKAGLTFDRCRIVMIAESNQTFFAQRPNESLLDLIKLVVPQFE